MSSPWKQHRGRHEMGGKEDLSSQPDNLFLSLRYEVVFPNARHGSTKEHIHMYGIFM